MFSVRNGDVGWSKQIFVTFTPSFINVVIACSITGSVGVESSARLIGLVIIFAPYFILISAISLSSVETYT